MVSSGGSLRTSVAPSVTLQGCLVAILLLFLPLKAGSATPGFGSTTPSGGTPATESVSEGSDMSDRETAGLRGPVKVCVQESVYAPGRKFSTRTEYSLDGKLLTVRHDYGDGSDSVFTYAYDGAGRSLSITNNQNLIEPTFATTNTAA